MINDFGKKIKEQRLRLGLSLRKVCESVLNEDGKSISVSYLNDIEQGHRKPPGGRIIIQLAEVLKLNSQELLNLAGKVDPFIEDAVSKEAEVAVLFRRIAERYEQNPEILKKLKAELDKEKGKKNDAVGG
jgi:transcriptional regulator with XRE-family HTH domain